MDENQIRTASRRSVLIRATTWLGAAAIAPALAFAGKAFAQAKLKKEAVEYQDKPKEGKDCDDCIQFIPGKTSKALGTCKAVEGPVSPHGYCLAFTPKPKRSPS